MPFDQAFDDVYKLGIKPACESAGAYCERLDDQIFHENMLHRVYNQISKADIIVSDMTSRNPNVFYETGYAHALNKRVVLLTKDASDIPFDLKHYPHIVYGSSIASLKDELRRRVEYFLANPAEPPKLDLGNLEIYVGEVQIRKSPTVDIILGDTPDFEHSLVVRFHNSGSTLLDFKQSCFGLVVPHQLVRAPKSDC
jgi:hypothetical protein